MRVGIGSKLIVTAVYTSRTVAATVQTPLANVVQVSRVGTTFAGPPGQPFTPLVQAVWQFPSSKI